MGQLMSIEHSEIRGFTVVRVQGEVEVLTAPRLADAVTSALGGERRVVVDLTDVTFLDSTGLGTLLRVTEAGEEGGEPLRLAVDENRPVVRPLQITGLERRLALYHSVEDATVSTA